NLFIAGEGRVELDGNPVKLRQTTRYPWDGKVSIEVQPEEPAMFSVNIRVPGWTRNQPVPSDLYRYVDAQPETATITVNGDQVPQLPDLGYVRIERDWKAGDIIEIELPMRVRRVISHLKVTENTGRVALERGPIVYCAEGVDNGGSVEKLTVADTTEMEAEFREDLLGGVVVIQGSGMTAVPYFAWSNRGEGEMAVWLPRDPI
ncbi:MAG: glycoside hydrolase family 127 protein, partial [bacterium]|nr:glycoside hydrolase family 127 protein [bacterium]